MPFATPHPNLSYVIPLSLPEFSFVGEDRDKGQENILRRQIHLGGQGPHGEYKSCGLGQEASKRMTDQAAEL